MQLMLGSQTQVPQARANLKHERLILLVSDEAKRRQLEKLPLLLDVLDLAADVLLDRLCLLVELDELARPQRLTISVQTSAPVHNVQNRVHIIRRLRNKAIFCPGMPTRNRLASDLLIARSLNREGRLVHLLEGHNPRFVGHGGLWS